MFRFSFFLLSLLVVACFATNIGNLRIILEEDAKIETPAYWVKLERVEASVEKSLIFAVKQKNLDLLHEIFVSVSNPKSPKYGQYLSIDELTEIIGSEENLQIVENFISQYNPKDLSIARNKDFIKATFTVGDIEKMLDTQLYYYRHEEIKEVLIIRADRHYSVPFTVATALDFVEGISRFPNFPTIAQKQRYEVIADESADDWPEEDCTGCPTPRITPNILKTRYNINHQADFATTQSTMSVAEFQGQYYIPNDLTDFQTRCGLIAQNVSQVEGEDKKIAGVESSLDIEYIMGVAVGVPSWFWYLNEYSIYDWIVQVLNTSNAPYVHSVSYGNDEAQNTKDYMQRTNDEFQKAATRGFSVLFASGDQGVWGREGVGMHFHPDFPAASPYVTAVGGTEFVGTNISQEVGTSWSGGGFSDNFACPDYQEDAVSAYFETAGTTLPPSSYYNSSGRGYPDVAAHCGNKIPYCIVERGIWSGVAGTSCSCPVFAGMVALLNDIRLSKGGSALGFLNPLIYQTATAHPEAFFDITVGNNKEYGRYGFPATTGWDPVTGVGTLNFEVMATLV